MTKESFDEIVGLIRNELHSNPTHSRPITVEEKVAIAIRYIILFAK
jgi:hypothetical protein